MNSSRKKLIAGIAISAGVLAGCGGQGASTQHKDAHSVRLVSWGTNEQIKLFRASLAKFTKKTGIAVQVIQEPGTNYAQKINAQILSKSLPDIFWCQNSMAQDLGRQGKLFNWSDYASGKASGATDAGLDITKFSPGAVDTYRTPDGGLAGIPNEANTYGVFYNIDAFRTAGVPLPTADWTWDQMFADAKALTIKHNGKVTRTGMQQVWGLLNSPPGMAFYSVSNGGAPLAKQKSLVGVTSLQADPKLVEGTQKLATAIKAGYITGPDFTGANTEGQFINGQVPMVFGGQWISSDFFAAKPKMSWGYAPLPHGTAGQVAPAEANGFCSPKDLANPTDTWKVIAWMDVHAFNDAYSQDPIAPIAYLPGSQGYFQALDRDGSAGKSVADTVRAELANPNKLGTTLLDPWSSKSGNITTATWNPALQHDKNIDAAVHSWISKNQALIDGH